MKKINVLGAKITVKIKEIDKELALAGFYDHESKTIVIDPTESNLFSTLIHELCHAYWHRSGLYQATRNQQMEEIFCESMANFLTDNIVALYQAYNRLKKLEK